MSDSAQAQITPISTKASGACAELGPESLRAAVLRNRPGKLSFETCEPTTTPFVAIENFDLTYHAGAKVLRHVPAQTVVKWRESDAVVVAPFFRNQAAQLEIVLMRRLAIGAGRHIWQLPKRYVAGPREYDLDSTTTNLLNKLGIEQSPDSPVFDMSGATATLPGLTPERMVLKSLDLGTKDSAFHKFVEDRFYGWIELRSFAARDIIKHALSGGMQSLEAFYAALRLERRVAATGEISANVREAIRAAPLHSYAQIDAAPMVKLDKIEDYLWGAAPPGVASSVDATVSATTTQSYVRVKRLRATQLPRPDSDFEPHVTLGERVEIIGQERQAMVLAFVRGPEGVYLMCNIGSRESAGRQLSHHFIQDDETERGVEPYWFGSSASCSADQIRDQFEKSTGTKLTTQLTSVGSYFLSPEFVNLKTDIFIAAVDPTTIKHDALDLQYQTLIPLNDINAGIIEGTIKSLPLGVGTELLARILNYTLSDPRHCRTKEEREDFERLKNKGGEFRRFLTDNFGDAAKKLLRSTTHQRLLEQAYNSGFDFKFTDSDFYAVIPEYGLVPRTSLVETLSFIQHDLIHGLQGNLNPWDFGPDPWDFNSSKTHLMSYRTYRNTILLDESHAVYFSESVMARKIGYDVWRQDSGKLSLGEILEQCGFNDRASRLRVVEEIVARGKIPEAILYHPDYHTRFRNVVLQFLSFYVRDLKNSKVAYDYWRDNPTVARIVAKLNPRFTSSPKEYRRNLQTIVSEVRDLTNRGMNPFRAELNRLREVPLLKLGIRAAYVYDHTTDQSVRARSKGLLDQIVAIGAELSEAERSVRGLVHSSRNVEASRVRNRKREELGRLSKDVLELIEAASASLPPKSQAQLQREVPLWQAPVDLHAPRWQRVYQLEANSAASDGE